MVQEDYNKLMLAAENGANMSIAINSDGKSVKSGFIPWERTASFFNMNTPKITIAASDLQNKAIVDTLMKCVLTGCYIYVPLSDYSFLADFENLKDIFICHGENIRNLLFLQKMKKLFMFYLEDASLPDLKPLIDVCNVGESGPGKCFGFCRCKIEDTSSLSEANFILSELLVWPIEGDDCTRWKSGRKPGIFKYYG